MNSRWIVANTIEIYGWIFEKGVPNCTEVILVSERHQPENHRQESPTKFVFSFFEAWILFRVSVSLLHQAEKTENLLLR